MLINICKFSLFVLSVLGVVNETSLNAKEKPKLYDEASLEKYLLPVDHPSQEPLKKLFTERSIFDDRTPMRNAGFTFFGHYARKLMVCTHPLLSNYVIKKFINIIPLENQLDGYMKRLKGRVEILKYIEKMQFKHIVIPQKYLFELPANFSDPITHKKSYLLIAEKMNLCSTKETKEGYHQISKEALKELCLLLLKFRGLDSSLENLPITKEGKIALIDLDKWEEDRPEYLRRVMDELTRKNKKYAEKLKKKYS